MRKNVSIGKRFASGVSPFPQSRGKILHRRRMTETYNNRRLYVAFFFFALAQHIPLFSSLIPVKLHFKHVHRFFLFAHVRMK